MQVGKTVITAQDFNKLYSLRVEIKIWERALHRLHKPELIKKIREHIQDITELEEKLTEYILGIPDSQLRNVIYMRSIEGQKWSAIASHIGGNNTEDSVRKMYKRFLDKL